MDKPHEALYAELSKRDVDFSVDREYKAEGLFLGAAVTLSNSSVMTFPSFYTAKLGYSHNNLYYHII